MNLEKVNLIFITYFKLWAWFIPTVFNSAHVINAADHDFQLYVVICNNVCLFQKWFSASWSTLLDQIVIKMVSLVEEQVSEPVVLKKVKKNKKRKLENENEAPAAETVLDVNFNPEAKQKKK